MVYIIIDIIAILLRTLQGNEFEMYKIGIKVQTLGIPGDEGRVAQSSS